MSWGKKVFTGAPCGPDLTQPEIIKCHSQSIQTGFCWAQDQAQVPLWAQLTLNYQGSNWSPKIENNAVRPSPLPFRFSSTEPLKSLPPWNKEVTHFSSRPLIQSLFIHRELRGFNTPGLQSSSHRTSPGPELSSNIPFQLRPCEENKRHCYQS